ncbi:MAG: translocation/assembly module TamB [Prolixibacteraceae bacterium]|nr:translocation/assembly module TamB [Prolixibacteraceae bacterium]
MSKMQTAIKRTIKAIIWVALSFILLFLILALLIQIPSVQTKIVRFATSFISTKTDTKVEIGNVSIAFPKSVVLEGLYLEDLNQDTLIYAGKAKINIALYDLLKNKIAISSFGLQDATVKLHSAKTDPLFNYNFLLTAFGDTTTQVKTDTLSASKWTFSLDEISLENIRFTYHDEYAGMNVFAGIKSGEISVELLDPGKSIYQFDEMVVKGLTAIVRRTDSGNTSAGNPESVLPQIGAKNLQISNSSVSFVDSIGNLSVNAILYESELEDFSIDLQKEKLNLESINLVKSQIRYHDFKPEIPLDSVVATSGNNWQVSVKSIEMMDNVFVYKIGNLPELKGLFDPKNLTFNHLDLVATDFFYSSDLTKASVKAFSAIDQNNFAFTGLETDFRMDATSITTNQLKFTTINSSIDTDFNIQFSSLDALIDSLEFINMDLDLKNLSFRNSDLLYFNPELIAQPFFKNRMNITTASGKVNGPLNDLKAKNLSVKTGANTIVKTDFHIKGLPKYETAFYDFPNLKFVSGKKDLVTFAGPYLPENMDIPENINLEMVLKGKLKEFATTANVTSSFGSANLTASVDPAENFNGKVILNKLNVGRFLKDTVMYGPVSLNAEADGKGLDMKTIQAKIKADVTELTLNKYTYHKLTVDGTVNGKQFEGKAKLDDENAAIDFDGLVNLNPNQEHYKFKLNVLGADLKKLKLTENDIQLSFVTAADLKGGSVDKMNGTAGITQIVVARDGERYTLDSFLTASVNEPNKSEVNVNSALIDIKYSGTVSPIALPALLSQFVNQYFPVTDSVQQKRKSDQSNFSFEIQVHNHPILSKVLFPDLLEFEPGMITGSFDSEKNDLKLNASIRKMIYGSTEINDFAVDVNSENAALNYKISSTSISNSQISFDNFSLDGKLTNNILFANVSSTDGKKKKLQLMSQLSRKNGNYKLTFDPKEFYLVNKQWNIAADNSIEFGKQGFRIHNFSIDHAESRIMIESVHDRFNDDLNIAIQQFRLDDISGIIEKDTAMIKGTVDGNVLMKRVEESYGLISDIKVNDLIVREVPIGNLSLKAARSETRKFDLDLNLSGPDNNLTATGYFVPNDNENTMNIKTVIQSLSMKTVEAFSMGQVTEASGILTGNILAEGTMNAPDISGELVFRDVFMKPSFLNNRLELKNETIQLKKDGIYFDSFTLLDSDQHTAIIDGSVQMKQFSDFIFALQVNATDFVLFNTTAKDNKEFFGRMVIDSKVKVSGPMNLPVVNARVKMKKGSNFTFSVPEDRLTTDKGEDVVEFMNPQTFHPILSRGIKKGAQSSGISGFDLSSIIEMDKEATLRLLMDPASTDSLVVKGEAALSFTMDPSGKMSLTGAYNLSDGSYMVSLESVIKKRFDIDAGSTIIWNGDPMDAEISINATYTVRASPIDLVADEISGLSDVDKGGYKQRYPFLVLLKLRGEILRPEISFEIQLSPENKGILGGAVNQKLLLLNEDESSLNKQVFALLVLGRFIQENPFQTESAGGTSTLIRSTVSRFLSAQLNQLSANVIPGMELNFDIQSYEDYQTGTAKGRTQVEIGVKQQLFNERLSVELGGSVDVEGDQAKQNSASDITSDVTVEYKLNKDGSFRMKGFRHNQYEGALEGQLVETGVGVVYVRDFNRWKRLFKPYKRKVQPAKLPEEEQ